MLPLFGPHEAAITDQHFTFWPSIQVTSSPFVLDDQFILTDRLMSMDLTATKDEPCMRGTFRFWMGEGSDSLAPSYVDSDWRTAGGRPVLDPGMVITVGAVINGVGCGTMWLGRIDHIKMTRGVVEVSCRDFGAYALNGVIPYGYYSASVDTIASKIRGICSEAYDQGGAINLLPQIAEPVPTGWMVNPYPQHPMTVMEAARQLVQTFGGDFRVVGREGWTKLCIINPNRAVPLATITIPRTRFLDIENIEYGDEDVRNIWDGYYPDANGLPVGPVTVSDTTSMDRYGPRYARIYLDRALNIDSDEEMTDFMNVALADSKDPFVSHSIRMPIFPHVELDDFFLFTFDPDHDEFAGTIGLNIVAFSHHWDSTPGSFPTTVLGGRAAGLGAYREYRRSTPPKAILTLTAPTTDNWAPIGTIAMVTDALV